MKDTALQKLISLLGRDRVLTDTAELLTYESDAMTLISCSPAAVVLPDNSAEVSEIIKILNAANIPYVPRGSGTGLSGGCLSDGGVVIALTRLNKILEIDPVNRYAVVESGVVNQWINERVKVHGLHFAPDPSSAHACTIGGNVAENAGGPHTMKYGVTSQHVLGGKMVLSDGKEIQFGKKTLESPGYDIPGIVNGSEGTFGIFTEFILKLTPLPEKYYTIYAVFETVDDAAKSIVGMLRGGITPAALELIDGEFVQALRDVFGMTFPENSGAVLFIEIDGPEAGMDEIADRIGQICGEYNVREIEAASTAEERARLWKARKLAFGAVGRLSPRYFSLDGVVPRKKLPEAMKGIHEIADRRGIRVANAFHAGDGNLHPCLMYDPRVAGDPENVMQAAHEVLELCVEHGGSLSGEHGIGIEKNNFMRLVFNDDDMRFMAQLKQVFDPAGLMNPGKIFPDDFNADAVKEEN